MDPFLQAVEQYGVLIDQLAEDASRHFGAIGDPMFEGIRFYTFDTITGSFDFDEAIELASEATYEIESCLMRIKGDYTLLAPILTKLKSVAPAFNTNGKTVFLGSWGMAPGEIGWMIRHINRRKAFDDYLQSASIDEATVDRYNDACERNLNHASRMPKLETGRKKAGPSGGDSPTIPV
ncbi:MAG: hypothetical protein V4675_09665 [Verrucomicrobiota bacterium]